MPQGFGFEARRGERRSGTDRRAELERRLQERRNRVGRVALELRRSERRDDERRPTFAGPERRLLPDRRSHSSRFSGGLRLTIGAGFEQVDG